MNEEILYGLSDIAHALEIFKPVHPWEELVTFWISEGRVKILWNHHERVYLHKFINEVKTLKPEKIIELAVLEDKNQAVLKAGLVYLEHQNKERTIKALEIAESVQGG